MLSSKSSQKALLLPTLHSFRKDQKKGTFKESSIKALTTETGELGQMIRLVVIRLIVNAATTLKHSPSRSSVGLE